MELTILDKRCRVLPVGGAAAGAARVLVLGDVEDLEPLAGLIRGRCFLAALSPLDWDAELTPWPAEGSRGRVWAGRLPELLPVVRELLTRLPEGPTYAAGYSLGGLAALYICCALRLDGAASCSGSLWYPGAVDYFRTQATPQRIYLSLGSKEKRARDPLMAQVETCTLTLRDALHAHYVQEPGGHFHEPEARLARGVDWLLR